MYLSVMQEHITPGTGLSLLHYRIEIMCVIPLFTAQSFWKKSISNLMEDKTWDSLKGPKLSRWGTSVGHQTSQLT